MKIFKNRYIILQNILKYSFVFVFLAGMFFSFIISNTDKVYAACPPDCPADSVNKNNDKADSVNKNNDKADSVNKNDTDLNIDVKINNPLGSKINSIPEFIEAILNIIVTIGVPIVALAIIYTGFLFVTAQGNSEKLTTAKNALLYTLIGAGLVLGAWVLANSIAGTVEQIRNEAR